LYLTCPSLSLEIPIEPDITSPEYVDWNLLPNGLAIFNFDLDMDGRVDYITSRRIKPSGQGEAKTQTDAQDEANNWSHSLFLYYFDSALGSWRWLAIERHPLFYRWNGQLYIDPEEDSINGNEQLYESLPKRPYLEKERES
jgi:hypothetical protein